MIDKLGDGLFAVETSSAALGLGSFGPADHLRLRQSRTCINPAQFTRSYPNQHDGDIHY